MKRYAWLLAAAAAIGCHTDSVTGSGFRFDDDSKTIGMFVGDEFSLTLLYVGPGEFNTPPNVSSGSVKFLGEADTCPCVPAGPTQQFRFVAAQPGTSIVRITSAPGSLNSVTVEDTIVVR